MSAMTVRLRMVLRTGAAEYRACSAPRISRRAFESAGSGSGDSGAQKPCTWAVFDTVVVGIGCRSPHYHLPRSAYGREVGELGIRLSDASESKLLWPPAHCQKYQFPLYPGGPSVHPTHLTV